MVMKNQVRVLASAALRSQTFKPAKARRIFPKFGRFTQSGGAGIHSGETVRIYDPSVAKWAGLLDRGLGAKT
jgi:hypothetical protein